MFRFDRRWREGGGGFEPSELSADQRPAIIEKRGSAAEIRPCAMVISWRITATSARLTAPIGMGPVVGVRAEVLCVPAVVEKLLDMYQRHGVPVEKNKAVIVMWAFSATRMASVGRLIWSRFNLFNVIHDSYKSGARPDRIDCME